MAFPRFQKPDYLLSIVIFALMVFGLVMISSSSVVESYQMTGGQRGNIFIINHLIAIALSLVFWIIFQNIDYHIYQRRGILFLIITIILLILPFVPGIGKTYGGAHRWIFLLHGFQPSELAKVTFIIYLATWFSKRESVINRFGRGFLPFVIILGIVVLILAAQPDIGTAAVC